MKTAPKNPAAVSAKAFTGIMTRKEAALKIAQGAQHVHCTALREKDPCYQVTCAQLEGKITPYPWQTLTPGVLTLTSSTERQKLIESITGSAQGGTKKYFAKRVGSVLEELITNAIFHSYRKADGTEKYSRSQTATLAANETVSVSFQENQNGIFLSVSDNGGTLSFKAISETLKRCYGDGDKQIESKEGGAGLGLYMVFETVSHLLIEVDDKKHTRVSCWIANKGSFDPQTFSFNFFYRRQL